MRSGLGGMWSKFSLSGVLVIHWLGGTWGWVHQRCLELWVGMGGGSCVPLVQWGGERVGWAGQICFCASCSGGIPSSARE